MKDQQAVEKTKRTSLKLHPLAKKYNCSVNYVSMVLMGTRTADSVKARKILQDAQDILAILERDTKVTV